MIKKVDMKGAKRQTGRQADRQARQTGRPADREPNSRQAGGQTYRQATTDRA